MAELVRALLSSGSWHDDGTWVYYPGSKNDPLSRLEELLDQPSAVASSPVVHGLQLTDVVGDESFDGHDGR